MASLQDQLLNLMVLRNITKEDFILKFQAKELDGAPKNSDYFLSICYICILKMRIYYLFPFHLQTHTLEFI
jgi:hypothetical protein